MRRKKDVELLPEAKELHKGQELHKGWQPLGQMERR